MNDKIVNAAAKIQHVLEEEGVTLSLDLKGYPSLFIVVDNTLEQATFIAASIEAEKRGLHSVRNPES